MALNNDVPNGPDGEAWSGPELLWTLDALRAAGLHPLSLARYSAAWLYKFTLSPKIVRWTYLFLVAQVVFAAYKVDLHWQWMLTLGYLLLSRTPHVSRADKRRPGVFFFQGEGPDSMPAWLLALSLSSCYVTAFDCTNALDAGASGGMNGGATAAVRYATLLLVGGTCYLLRAKRFPYACSLTEVIQQRFGMLAGMLFQMVTIYRLYTFVWSNAGAVADFYAPQSRRHDTPWWVAVLLTVGASLLITAQGGMRASLYADGLLGLCTLFGIVAVAIHLVVTSPGAVAGAASQAGRTKPVTTVGAFAQGNTVWGLSSGSDALVVAALEAVTSFGFMDPIVTDRAFLATPKRMMGAFSVAAVLAGIKAFALCFVGVRAVTLATARGSSSDVDVTNAGAMAHSLPWVSYQTLTMVWLAAGLSALIATLASASRAWALEMQRLAYGSLAVLTPERAQAGAVWAGRTGALAFAMVATLPLLTNNAGALRATFATGMPVLGLGWPLLYAALTPRRRNVASPLVFLLPLCCSIAVGLAYQISTTSRKDVIKAPNLVPITISLLPDAFLIGSGAQKHRLAWTLLILAGSFGLCAVAAGAEALLARGTRDEGVGGGVGVGIGTSFEAEEDEEAGGEMGGGNEDGDAQELAPSRDGKKGILTKGRYGARVSGSGPRYDEEYEAEEAAVAAARAKAAELAKLPEMADDLQSHPGMSRRSGLGAVAGVRFSRTSRSDEAALAAEQENHRESLTSDGTDDLDLLSGITRRISHGLARLAGRVSGVGRVSQAQGGGDVSEAPRISHHPGEEPQEAMVAVPVALADGLRPRKSQLGGVLE